jgi:hypothetical protein
VYDLFLGIELLFAGAGDFEIVEDRFDSLDLGSSSEFCCELFIELTRFVSSRLLLINESSKTSISSLFFSTTGKPNISQMFDGKFLKFFI